MAPSKREINRRAKETYRQTNRSKPVTLDGAHKKSSRNEDSGVTVATLKPLAACLTIAVVALSAYAALYGFTKPEQSIGDSELVAETIQDTIEHFGSAKKSSTENPAESQPAELLNAGVGVRSLPHESAAEAEIDALTNAKVGVQSQKQDSATAAEGDALLHADVGVGAHSQRQDSAAATVDEAERTTGATVAEPPSRLDLQRSSGDDNEVRSDSVQSASESQSSVSEEPVILLKQADSQTARRVELDLGSGAAAPLGNNGQEPIRVQRLPVKVQDEIYEEKSERQDQRHEKRSSSSSEFTPTFLRKIAPKKVFIDGRRIPPVELIAQKPNNSSVRVYLFNDLLSAEECDSLRKAHERHVAEGSKIDPIICFDSVHTLRQHLANVGMKAIKVSPSDFTPGTTCLNATFSAKLKVWLNANWSYSTAFYPGESKFSLIMSQRLKDSMGLMPENGGKFQITSYPLNVGYKGHTDCTIDSTDRRDRVATVLVYLETVAEGGETEFPELGIWVKPRKGRALLWNNMDESGKCEPMSIHHAAKVKDGHKYILQRWYYYESFGALGKRPAEPKLPARAPGQPRVTCDEYEHGSCRWYDEWNYEHIVEYNRKKHSLT